MGSTFYNDFCFMIYTHFNFGILNVIIQITKHIMYVKVTLLAFHFYLVMHKPKIKQIFAQFILKNKSIRKHLFTSILK